MLDFILLDYSVIVIMLCPSDMMVCCIDEKVATSLIMQFSSMLQKMQCEEYGPGDQKLTLLGLISMFSLVNGLKR